MDSVDQIKYLAPKENRNIKAKCPECSSSRKNKRDKSLSISREGNKILYYCHHCEWKGSYNEYGGTTSNKIHGGEGNKRADPFASRLRAIKRGVQW